MIEAFGGRQLYYDRYASTHSGVDVHLPTAVLRRDVIRHLSQKDGPVLDLGCGQGHLVRTLLSHGYSLAKGIDVSPEQVALARSAGLPVELADAELFLTESRTHFTAITAVDFLEHLTRDELSRILTASARRLTSRGVLVGRVPNAVSPFGGYYRHGDVTHESWFTARSVRQLALNAGFCKVELYACPPLIHGLPSALRAAVWKGYSGAFKLALIAETGVSRGHIVTQNLVFTARK